MLHKKQLRKWFKKEKSKNNKFTFEKEGSLLYTNYMDFKIYTHDKACVKRAHKQIFENHVYNFNSKTEAPYIIDAGANIGLAVLYWKKKYPKAKIIAFEPSKLAFASLLANVKENHLTDVTCINKALSDSKGVQSFTTNEIISGSLVTEKNLEINYEVEITTLGEYLSTEVNFLKIDIEGAEKFIFKDIKENINNLNHVFLEYHSFVNEQQYLSKYLELFEKNSLRYFIEDEYKRNNHFVDEKISLNQDMQLNIWAKKI